MQPTTNTKVSLPSHLTAAQPPMPIKTKLMIAGGIALAVFIVGYAGYRWWTYKPVPRLNAPINEIAAYVCDTGFRKLPVERQFVYLKALDERGDDMRTAHQQKKISDNDFAAAKAYAWFGKHLSRMEKYASFRNANERQKYIDKLIAKKLAPKPPDPKTGAKPDPEDDNDVDRDASLEKVLPLTWPGEVRQQWETYRKALRDREKQLLQEGIRIPGRTPKPATKPN